MAFLFGGGDKTASNQAQQSNQQAQFALQMQQQQAQQLAQSQALMQSQSNTSTKNASAQIGNPNAYAGLIASPENSSIFNTSTLKTGRSSLLGN